MSAYAEYAWSHANIPAELSSVRPLGDCVLVRVVPEPEMAGLIVMPTGARERGYQAPRIGEVIACGPGDALYEWYCNNCLCVHIDEGPPKISFDNATATAENIPGVKLGSSKAPDKCSICGHSAWELSGISNHPMHVKPGDRILYWRCQANEVVINEETYQFLHEEQHVLAVLEN